MNKLVVGEDIPLRDLGVGSRWLESGARGLRYGRFLTHCGHGKRAQRANEEVVDRGGAGKYHLLESRPPDHDQPPAYRRLDARYHLLFALMFPEDDPILPMQPPLRRPAPS